MEKGFDNKKEDIEIVCVSCGKKFIFSAGEQDYYKERGLKFPKRCKNCRGNNKSYRGIPTIIGKKNTRVESQNENSLEKKAKPSVTRQRNHPIGRKCGECAIGDSDKCPRPIHSTGSEACGDFISKATLTEDMIEKFPSQGKASDIKYGKEGLSQFERAKRESTKTRN